MFPCCGLLRTEYHEPAPHYNTALFNGDMEELKSAVGQQVEYYFSIENLVRDMYIRGLMDEQQFVPLADIGRFNRVWTLTNDLSLIAEVLATSTVVELIDGKVRRREHPERFPRIEPVFTPTFAPFVPGWGTGFQPQGYSYDLSAPEYVPSASFATDVVVTDVSASEPTPTDVSSVASQEPTNIITPSVEIPASTAQAVPAEKSEADWVTKTPPKQKITTKPRSFSSKPEPAASKVLQTVESLVTKRHGFFLIHNWLF